MIKRIVLKLYKVLNYGKYLKKIGVNLDENVHFVDRTTNFGSEPYLIFIHKNTKISNNVQFITHDGGTYVFRKEKKYQDVIKFGKIEVGSNCFVGARSILLPNIKIGNNVVVAAGSVVTKSVPNDVVIAGNPAKIICSINEYKEKSLINCSKYNKENFKKNKKNEVIKLCNTQRFKEELK